MPIDAAVNTLSDAEVFRSRICQRSGRVLSLVVGICALVVALGWLANFDFVKYVLPGMATMKFNTSLCFMLVSLSTVIQYKVEISDSSRTIAKLLAAIVLLISTATLSQYLFELDLGLDQLFVADNAPSSQEFPGRMSIGTALSFGLAATALLVLEVEVHARHSPAQQLAILSTLISGAALLGYLYGATTFSLQIFSSMALNTALLFVLTGFAILLIRPNHGLMRFITSDQIGGSAIRLILPAVLVIPIITGWLSFLGSESGYYSIEFAFSLFSLLSIVILMLLGWLGARALNNAEKYFMATFESAPTAMIVTDASGAINRVNSLTESYFGYERKELIEKKIEMLIPPQYRGAHPQLRDEFNGNPEARQMGKERDLFGLRKDGTEFPVEVGLNPIATPRGMLVVSAITDITQRKQHEMDLKSKSDELARSNNDLEQFAYLASHDLQEPLRAISGSVQLLQARYSEKLDAKANEYIAHATDGANRMHTLIEDLLTYSRVGRIDEVLDPVDLNVVLKTALKNLSATIEKHDAQINAAQLPTLPVYASQISMLFQNLIGNAIKFHRPGVNPEIDISALEEEQHWRFVVQDNGIGVESQFYKRVFEIFQRLHTRREYAGTGIGLAVCKKIVSHHQGTIWLESEVGQGTTISFRLKKDLGDESN